MSMFKNLRVVVTRTFKGSNAEVYTYACKDYSEGMKTYREKVADSAQTMSILDGTVRVVLIADGYKHKAFSMSGLDFFEPIKIKEGDLV